MFESLGLRCFADPLIMGGTEQAAFEAQKGCHENMMPSRLPFVGRSCSRHQGNFGTMHGYLTRYLLTASNEMKLRKALDAREALVT